MLICTYGLVAFWLMRASYKGKNAGSSPARTTKLIEGNFLSLDCLEDIENMKDGYNSMKIKLKTWSTE